MKKLLTDYHFHPNLRGSGWLARSKAKLIWEELTKQQVDVLFVTEHVYKRPEYSYRKLIEHKPKKANTHIFPGVEAVSSEGVDVLIYSNDADALYADKKIFTQDPPTLMNLIEHIKAQSHLFGSIAHPFCVGKSGIIKRLGYDMAKEAISALGGVEVHNICYRGSNVIADASGLGKIFKETREFAEKTTNLPDEYYDLPNVSLYTGGSDAHVLVEIGSGMLVEHPADEVTAESAFTAAMHNTGSEFRVTKNRLYFWRGIYKLFSVIEESNRREWWLRNVSE